MFYTIIPSAYHALTSKTWAFWREAAKYRAKRAVFVYAAHALANKRGRFGTNAAQNVRPLRTLPALTSKTRAFRREGHHRMSCVTDLGLALKIGTGGQA